MSIADALFTTIIDTKQFLCSSQMRTCGIFQKLINLDNAKEHIDRKIATTGKTPITILHNTSQHKEKKEKAKAKPWII